MRTANLQPSNGFRLQRSGGLCVVSWVSSLFTDPLKQNGSVDLGYHTRCHTRYALGSHTHQHKETPPHSNGAKAHAPAHARQVR